MCELSKDDISNLRERWDFIYYTKTETEPSWICLPPNTNNDILLKDVIILTFSNWPAYKEIESVGEINYEFQCWLRGYDLCHYKDGQGNDKQVPPNHTINIDYTSVHGSWVNNCREKYKSYNIDLRGINFSNQAFDENENKVPREIFLFGVNLDYSILEKSIFEGAKFWFCSIRNSDVNSVSFLGSSFHHADLTGSNLEFCHFQNANLCGTKLYDTYLKNARFNEETRVDSKTRFVDSDKFKYILAENAKRYEEAADTYGYINNLYVKNGLIFNANNFRYRELVCRRKADRPLKRFSKFFFFELPFKYALSPLRCLVTIFFIIIIFSGVFLVNFNDLDFGESTGHEKTIDQLCASLHFSVASFSTVGFGDISPKVASFSQFMSNFESIVGVVVMGVFIASILKTIT